MSAFLEGPVIRSSVSVAYSHVGRSYLGTCSILLYIAEGGVCFEPCGEVHVFVADADDSEDAAGEFAEENTVVPVAEERDAWICRRRAARGDVVHAGHG